VVVLLNEQDQVRYQQRFTHHLPTILEPLAPYHTESQGVVVESTYHWSWLVDGLLDADSRVPLAHPAALEQYRGLQDTNAQSDARWLAPLFRLGVLPEGTISPKAKRAVRDVLRTRSPLVAQHPSNVLSVQNILVRPPGVRFGVKQIHKLSQKDLEALRPEAEQVLAVPSSLALLECLRHQMPPLEQAVRKHLTHTPAYEQLLGVTGSGEMLAQTILLETGHLGRFATVGHSASSCRWVKRTTISNGKRKGQGTVKNGHPSRAWADMEAVQFALRVRPKGQRFYPRQAAKSPLMSARKSVAHKLARACFSVMRDLVPFEVHKAGGCSCATRWGGVGDGAEIGCTTMAVIRPRLTP
jgi:transposase